MTSDQISSLKAMAVDVDEKLMIAVDKVCKSKVLGIDNIDKSKQ